MKHFLLTCIILSFHFLGSLAQSSIESENILVLKNRRSLNNIGGNYNVLVLKHRINLKGEILMLPKDCCVKYEGGYFVNGSLVLRNNSLEGKVRIQTPVSGIVKNDTIRAEWFTNSEHVLANLFNIAEGKVVLFDKRRKFDVNYVFLIPSCEIIGNQSLIQINGIKDHSPISSFIKLRNKHYDGGGTDSFTIRDLIFETKEDGTFIFSIQNANNIVIDNCSFRCLGQSKECMHSLDFRGNIHNVDLHNCQIINLSGAKAGGGLWIRSFGAISDIRINNCLFYNNTTDEAFALNAVENDIERIEVNNCSFHYERDKRCPYPHVFWGFTNQRGVNNYSIHIQNSTLSSNYLPSFILNTNDSEDVLVKNCFFSFLNFTTHHDRLITTLFNGKMEFVENEVIIDNFVEDNDPLSQVNLFSQSVNVRQSFIKNNCEKCHLGSPHLFSSTIYFDKGQLFNGRLPAVMNNCTIKLGHEVSEVAANTYDQEENCIWSNNSIESVVPVKFVLNYRDGFLLDINNTIKNIDFIGSPFIK